MAQKNAPKKSIKEMAANKEIMPAGKVRKADNPINIENVLADNRGHYCSLVDMVMELLDNALSAFRATGIGSRIAIYVTYISEKVIEVVVRDDGPGIANIDAALSIGCKDNAQTSLNDHGQGFKNLAVLSIEMRNTYMGKSSFVKGPFVPGVDIVDLDEMYEDLPHGVEFKMQMDMQYLQSCVKRQGEEGGAPETNDFFTLCKYAADTIGWNYGLMHANFPDITIYAKKGKKEEPITVKPLYLVFEEEVVSDTVMSKLKHCFTSGSRNFPAFNGDGEITLVFRVGRAHPNRYSPLGYGANNQENQCFNIAINQRMISRTARLSRWRVTHPDFNGMMGIVDIQVKDAAQAPKTEIAKNGFVKNDYIQLSKMINQLVPDLSKLLRGYKKLPTHKQVQESLQKHLKAQTHLANGENNRRVVLEYNIDPITKQKMDVVDFDTRIAYEIKTKLADVAAVDQVCGYIDTLLDNATMLNPCPVDVIWLCAPHFSDAAIERIKKANRRLAKHTDIRILRKNLHCLEGANFPEDAEDVVEESEDDDI